MTISRRGFLHFAAGGAALAAMPQPGLAQAYPSRPVTLVVFVPPGGAPDIVARLIGQPLSQRLGQPVVIENRPGGGGNLALQAVVRAPADGHTLLLIATPHAVNVTLYEKQTINVIRDIVPVASIDNDAFSMVVNPSLPVRTVAEFIAHAKSNPGKVNMGSSGSGNLSHLAGELFKMMTGTEMVHVPYRGMPAAITALMTGDVHVVFDALAVVAVARQGRQGARDRGDDRHAREGVAGRSAGRRSGARLRGDRMAGHRRAQGHTGRHCRADSARKSTPCSPIPRR